MAFSSRRPPPPFHHQRNGSFPNAPAPAPRPRTGANLQFRNTFDIFVTPHGRPAQSDSSSDDDAQPSSNLRTSRYRPTHCRSMSHPFPSLFVSKKNKQQQQHLQPTLDDSADDDYPGPGQASVRSSMAMKPPRGPADFANGNCMTCGGRVRWPKELSVFRCTTCLTINDLKPYAPKPFEDGKPPEPVRPISLAQTKNLVHHCLVEALNTFAAPEGSSSSGGGPSSGSGVRKYSNGAFPSQSPSRTPQDYFSKQSSPSRHGRSPSLGVPPPAHAYNPVFDDYGDGHCDPNALNGNHLTPARAHSTSYPDSRSSYFHMGMRARDDERLDPRRVFKPVENYLVSRFGSFDTINDAFAPRRQSISSRDQMHVKRKPVPAPAPQSAPVPQPAAARQERSPNPEDSLVAELDAKLLLLGDLGENALWWTGSQPDAAHRSRSQRRDSNHPPPGSRSPRIEWGEVMGWYQTVIDAARPWTHIYNEAVENNRCRVLTTEEKQRFEAIVLEAQDYLQRALLKCTEMFLKRPGRVLKEAHDVRFLLILLANPLLGPEQKSFAGEYQQASKGKGVSKNQQGRHDEPSGIARHSVIIKRILGLISHSSDQCHHQLVAWLSRLPEHLFLQIKDLVGSFVNYRLKRQSEKKVEAKIDITGGLIPEMSNNRAGNTPATLHAALAASSKKQKQQPEQPRLVYSEDWQLKAGAKVMALVFAANNLTHVRRNEVSTKHAHGHLLATSDFYNTMLDCLDFQTDFEAWESRKGKFSFCQYPFFLSIWAKIQILEFDAKRQMQGKAREAFFDSILSHKSYNQYLFISVRRECLIEDSLMKVSEVVGSGSEDIKKGLRIEFQGEEGVDAGGLRKEWFQLLVREVFNPDHGKSVERVVVWSLR
jgi:E3 ubiquitin-protein ligase HECTD2